MYKLRVRSRIIAVTHTNCEKLRYRGICRRLRRHCRPGRFAYPRARQTEIILFISLVWRVHESVIILLYTKCEMGLFFVRTFYARE